MLNTTRLPRFIRTIFILNILAWSLLLFCNIGFFSSGGDKCLVRAQENSAFPSDGVVISFFYSPTCPHCAHEKSFLDELEGKYPSIKVNRYEASSNRDLMVKFYEEYKVPQDVRGYVPATFIKEKYWIGFGSNTGSEIESYVAGLTGEEQTLSDESEDLPESDELPSLPEREGFLAKYGRVLPAALGLLMLSSGVVILALRVRKSPGKNRRFQN